MARQKTVDPDKLEYKPIARIPKLLYLGYLRDAGVFSPFADDYPEDGAMEPKEVRRAEIKLGALHGRKIVGFVASDPMESPHDGEKVLGVKMVYVGNRYRRNRISRRLMESLVEEARARGAKGVDWNVTGPIMQKVFTKMKEERGHEMDFHPGQMPRIRFRK